MPSWIWALSVTPTYQVFRLKQGGKTMGQLTITADETTDLIVTPSVKEFYTLAPNKNIKVNDWMQVNAKPFELKKGESRTFTFEIKVPKKAQGELAGVLHFDTKSPIVGMITLQLSLAVYVAVEGTEKPSMDIDGVSIKVSTNTSVAILVHNKGNIHLRPRGLVQIYDEKEKLLMNAMINQGDPALPGQPRMYSSTVKDYRLPSGSYVAHIGLDDADWGYQFPLIKKKFSIDKDGKVSAR
jgi:hypothetical protein